MNQGKLPLDFKKNKCSLSQFSRLLVCSVKVVKVRKVVLGLVEHLVQMESREQEDLKVLKGKRAHLDQDLKDNQERRCHTYDRHALIPVSVQMVANKTTDENHEVDLILFNTAQKHRTETMINL